MTFLESTLRKARQEIRQWIAQWPDQKLADVYAFNQDGRMDPNHSCCCIIGVSSSDVLHQGCSKPHYADFKNKHPQALAVEMAFFNLRLSAFDEPLPTLQRRFSAILRAEMRRRSHRRRRAASYQRWRVAWNSSVERPRYSDGSLRVVSSTEKKAVSL